jgi:hypothetical protein
MELVYGWRLARLAVGKWGSEEFWKLLNWWWQEIHVDIPHDKEVMEMTTTMREVFDYSNTCISVSNSPGTFISNCNFNVPVRINSNPLLGIDSTHEGIVTINCLDTKDEKKGDFYIPQLNLLIASRTNPNIISKWALKLLFGAEWKAPKPPTLYTSRLKRAVEASR